MAPSRPPTVEMMQGCPATAGDRLSWNVIGALVAMLLVRGIILACVLPPFEGWDEYQHVAYVDHAASSSAPAIYGETLVPEEFLRAVAAFPQPKDALAAVTGAVGYERYWDARPRPLAAPRPALLYQAQHSPLYYRLVAPIYRACGGRDNLRLAVSVLRLVNLALGALAILAVLRWLRRRLPRQVALPAAACVVLQPLLLLNLVRVSSDALAFALGTMVVVASFAIDERPTLPRALLLSLVLPLAVLAKATNLALVPFVAVVLGLQFPRHRRVAALAVAAVLAGLAVMTWPYFSFNLHRFGTLTPMQESIANRAAGHGLWAMLTNPPARFWPAMARSLWVRNAFWVGGWSFLQLPRAFIDLYEVFLGLGAVATVAGLVRRPSGSRDRVLILVLLVSVHAGLMYHAVQSYSAWGVASTNAWYAATGIPWLLILATSAIIASPWPRAAAVVAFAFAAGELLAESYGVWRRMIPFYYRGDGLAESLRRASLLHPAGMGAVTVTTMVTLLAVLVLYLGFCARSLSAAHSS